MLSVEFTVEPFVDGRPGPHVTEAVAAVEKHGITVDFGPFGSVFAVASGSLGRVVGDLMDAAYAHGATVVNLTVSKVS
ncbi:MAG: hypothetical protein ACO3IV_05260 [Ilumatobacteraceae bacterium]|jgi:uncharacterized protein YqgV (UPF0045/DUF77 family)